MISLFVCSTIPLFFCRKFGLWFERCVSCGVMMTTNEMNCQPFSFLIIEFNIKLIEMPSIDQLIHILNKLMLYLFQFEK